MRIQAGHWLSGLPIGALLLTTVSRSLAADPAGPRVQILQLATYAAEELRIDPDATWWGLHPVGEAFELREAKPTLTEVPDPFDHGEAGRKALQVSVEGDQPLFLFSGLPNAGSGPIRSAFPAPRFLHPGEVEILTPGWTPAEPYAASGKLLRIGAVGEVVAADHGPSIRSYSLVVYRHDSRGGQLSQQIARFDTPLDEFRPAVYWAGDLDRDGTVDVIVDLSDDPMLAKVTLFLSSAASGDQILAPVAEATSAQY